MKRLLRNILVGFVVWSAYTFLNAGILAIQIKLTYLQAWTSSAILNYSMALLSLPLWYACRRFPFRKSRMLFFFGTHVAGGFLFSALWVATTFALYRLFFGKFVTEAMLSQGVHLWQFLDGITKYALLVGIFYTIDFYKKFKEKELRETELNLLTRNMELQNLKSQLNPHFLFNALNSVNALIATDPERARTMNAKLAELLRSSLDGYDAKFVTLKEELDFVHNYMDIEKVRLGNKLRVDEHVDPALLGVCLPSMILQPIVENAIKHGIYARADGGTISLTVSRDHGTLYITVCNTCKPLQETEISPLSNKGIGLKNTAERLTKLYGDESSLEFTHVPPDGVRVAIRIPLTGQDI